MRAPQIIIICLYAMGLGIALVKHGELKDAKECRYNFWRTLISVAMEIGLLIWGGFFG